MSGLDEESEMIEAGMYEMSLTPPASPPSSSSDHQTAGDNAMSSFAELEARERESTISRLGVVVSPVSEGVTIASTNNTNSNNNSRTPPRPSQNPQEQLLDTSSTLSPPPEATAATAYHFARVQSSPCVIDASPKPTAQKRSKVSVATPPPSIFATTRPTVGPVQSTTNNRIPINAFVHKSELTPVTRNTSCDEAIITTDDKSSSTIASLSVPESKSLANNHPHPLNSRMSIRPRTHSNTNPEQRFNHSVRPISPPSISSYRASAATDVASDTSIAAVSSSSIVQPSSSFHPIISSSTQKNNEEQGSDEERHQSPLAQVQLDRNYHSFESRNNYLRQRSSLPETPPTSAHTQSPDCQRHCLTPDELENIDDADLAYVIPYQPSRDSSLASFGVGPDDLDDIFLAPRPRAPGGEESDHFPSSPYKNVSDPMNLSIHDDMSHVSIPSIHLAHQLQGSTQSSYATNSYYDEDEDSLASEGFHFTNNGNNSIFNNSSTYSNAHHTNVVLPSPHGARQNENEMPSHLTNNRRRNSKGSRNRQSQQALEWLNTVKVNDTYVAEAASSKFLRSVNQPIPLDARTKSLGTVMDVSDNKNEAKTSSILKDARTNVENGKEKSGKPPTCSPAKPPAKVKHDASNSNKKVVETTGRQRQIMGRNIGMFPGPATAAQKGQSTNKKKASNRVMLPSAAFR